MRAFFLLTIMIFSSLVAKAEPTKVSQLEGLVDSAKDESAQRFLVIIDPGHGGHDFGTINKSKNISISEKSLTLQYAKLLGKALNEKGIATILTRSEDDYVNLDLRAAVANRAQGSLFISLHINSSPKPNEWGIETFVLNNATNDASQRLADIENGRKTRTSNLAMILADLETSASYKDSVNLACQIQKGFAHSFQKAKMPFKNRGVKSALFYVLMQTQMPSILVELGFASNQKELLRLKTPSYQTKLVDGLVAGIQDYKDGWSLKQTIAAQITPERSAFSAISKQRIDHCTVK